MTSTQNRQGMLSIESRNIFSILKKWLYTEQDIVFRELVSNAVDAIEKRAALEGARREDAAVVLRLDAGQGRLIIADNGVGMSSAEVDKYINNIAFSGAEEFISRSGGDKGSIIGHFGVGFYSAFMLADHVAIETRSCTAGAPAVRWDCRADMSFSMEAGAKPEPGTEVILYLDAQSPYLANPGLVQDAVHKYFRFAGVPIYLEAPGFDHVLLNDPTPLWKQPREGIDPAGMDAFYQDFFADSAPPLFWVQFESVDIGLRGILYFRATKRGTEDLDGSVKIYSRGVYIGENIPALVPKFVGLQNGIVECDNLDLVVSRAALREEDADGAEDVAALVYECLAQETTIALNELFQHRRAEYESFWPELNAFVKYGVMQDKTFASVMARKVIYLDLYGKYHTIPEYLGPDRDAWPDRVYYASDRLDQAHYIDIFKKCGFNALLFDHVIDQPLMYRYEVLYPNLKFMRLDADIEGLFADAMVDGADPEAAALTEKLGRLLGGRLNAMPLKYMRHSQTDISALIVKDEQSRRMTDMLEIYGLLDPEDDSARAKQGQSSLLLNLSNPILRYVLHGGDDAKAELAAGQLLDLALMSQQALKPEDVEPFLRRSQAVLAAMLG